MRTCIAHYILFVSIPDASLWPAHLRAHLLTTHLSAVVDAVTAWPVAAPWLTVSPLVLRIITVGQAAIAGHSGIGACCKSFFRLPT